MNTSDPISIQKNANFQKSIHRDDAANILEFAFDTTTVMYQIEILHRKVLRFSGGKGNQSKTSFVLFLESSYTLTTIFKKRQKKNNKIQ